MSYDLLHQVSPHFTFAELTRTDHASLQQANRDVPPEHFVNLHTLAKELLEPIREHFGPVVIHSAYRSAALNRAVGGSPTSQHALGQAADFHCTKAGLQEVWEWIWKESHLPFGQLILEGHAPNQPTWVHVSLGRPWHRNSGQVMTFDGKRYTTVARVQV